jgi:hypothetical protein
MHAGKIRSRDEVAAREQSSQNATTPPYKRPGSVKGATPVSGTTPRSAGKPTRNYLELNEEEREKQRRIVERLNDLEEELKRKENIKLAPPFTVDSIFTREDFPDEQNGTQKTEFDDGMTFHSVDEMLRQDPFFHSRRQID